MKVAKCLTCIFVALTVSICEGFVADPKGYVVYCPCMGRFGNQAEDFLGTLAFAVALNRTLVLAPWLDFDSRRNLTDFIPFEKYFKLEPLQAFHKVIRMEDFMEHLAPKVWPQEQRYVFCYLPRNDVNDCEPMRGPPFSSLWTKFGIKFDRSIIYAPLVADASKPDMMDRWLSRYTPDIVPVLAFLTAPNGFPLDMREAEFHRHMQWSDELEDLAMKYRHEVLPQNFIAIHLRNGKDWVSACNSNKNAVSMYSSAQCMGDGGRKMLSYEMCLPNFKTILHQVKQSVKNYSIDTVFVGSDYNHSLEQLSHGLRRYKVHLYRYAPSNPHVDLILFARATHFIANCISSFSAFAVRERRLRGLPVTFWDYPRAKTVDPFHNEL